MSLRAVKAVDGAQSSPISFHVPTSFRPNRSRVSRIGFWFSFFSPHPQTNQCAAFSCDGAMDGPGDVRPGGGELGAEQERVGDGDLGDGAGACPRRQQRGKRGPAAATTGRDRSVPGTAPLGRRRRGPWTATLGRWRRGPGAEHAWASGGNADGAGRGQRPPHRGGACRGRRRPCLAE
jgi:hypothetical protein